eukprot:3743597-Pyramimonas_sp.AAC.1
MKRSSSGVKPRPAGIKRSPSGVKSSAPGAKSSAPGVSRSAADVGPAGGARAHPAERPHLGALAGLGALQEPAGHAGLHLAARLAANPA